MKLNLILLFTSMIAYSLPTQTSYPMEKKIITTQIGQIATYSKLGNPEKTPIIFLHGVYFDHHLWENQLSIIDDRTIILIDMPLHGESKAISKKDWNIDDCAHMLLEILDSLQLKKVVAVGHSWGSMTIVRAANKSPNRFAALGLCNMPFKELTAKEKRTIKLQHSAILFRKFYMKQAGKSLMSKESISNNPGLLDKITQPMRQLNNKEIKYTDKAVRIDAKDATHLIKNLTTPMIALVGKEDYVGIPPINDLLVVKGGHVSPLEAPNRVNHLINNLLKLEEN